MSELKLKVKPKPGDREPTEEDYESSEEEKTDDGEFDVWRLITPKFQFDSFLLNFSEDDRSVAYQIPTKDNNGGR